MGLLTNILTFPLAPVRGTVALAEQIRKQAESEYYDPVRIRRQLEDIAAARESGVLEPSEADALEDELVQRLLIATERQRKG